MSQLPVIPEADLVTQEDLEILLTAEKLRQLGGHKGVSEPDNPWVKKVLAAGTGFVLGKIQIALKIHSIDYLWFNVWTDRDKAEIKRLCEGACQYYAHAYGQKVEEVPESSKDLLEMIEKRCTEIAEHHATAGNDPPVASSTQHDIRYSPGAGHTCRGQPRHNWGGY
jgi:hypothetical protein